MGKVAFKVSARAGKLLGRENFTNAEGAIIELVKNSYDADAKHCLVIFEPTFNDVNDNEGNLVKIFSLEDSHIYIIDNGDGMSKATIETKWMMIGTGNKEKEIRSPDRRVKTGAKGIGRFALDRLGKKSQIWTRGKNDNHDLEAHYWEMDWSQFDNMELAISQIEAILNPIENDLKYRIETELPKTTKIEERLEGISFDTGTLIKISDLKDVWIEPSINNIFEGLEKLIPPSDLQIPFEVSLYSTLDESNYGLVKTAFYDDFDYRVKASFDPENLEVSMDVKSQEFNVSQLRELYYFLYKDKTKPYDFNSISNQHFEDTVSLKKLFNTELSPVMISNLKKVGNITFTFYYLGLGSSSNYPVKNVNVKSRKEILERFGGVKIYRDSFRVRPYGDKGNDWLNLAGRKSSSPAGVGQRIGDWRVTAGSTAGLISISRETNSFLIDKSDRGSLVSNETFETFKNLVLAIIHYFEKYRSKLFNPIYLELEKIKKIEKERILNQKASEIANSIIQKEQQKENSSGRQESSSSHQNEETRKEYEDIIRENFISLGDNDELYKEIVQVRALASLGLIFSSFAHELKTIRNNSHDINELAPLVTKVALNQHLPQDVTDMTNIIEMLVKDSDKIQHWIDYALTAIKKDRRNRKQINLSEYFESLGNDWRILLESKNIEISVDVNSKINSVEFRFFEMDLATIFSNLITNSIESFTKLKDPRDRVINISVELDINQMILIDYCDNGIGLSDIFSDPEDIFNAFTTSKKSSTGEYTGTGLGMYLVKNVIDDNKGIIELKTPQFGFQTLITLPTRSKNV